MMYTLSIVLLILLSLLTIPPLVCIIYLLFGACAYL